MDLPGLTSLSLSLGFLTCVPFALASRVSRLLGCSSGDGPAHVCSPALALEPGWQEVGSASVSMTTHGFTSELARMAAGPGDAPVSSVCVFRKSYLVPSRLPGHLTLLPSPLAGQSLQCSVPPLTINRLGDHSCRCHAGRIVCSCLLAGSASVCAHGYKCCNTTSG